MNYKKTITIYNDDDSIALDFDIVLNRAIAVSGLYGHPVLADMLLNGAGAQALAGVDMKDEENLIANLIENKALDKLFIINDELPLVIQDIFPQMLDAGVIRAGTREEILELAEALVFDEDFSKSMNEFFTDALRQKGRAQVKKVKFAIK